nr:MAG TPA: hypothetical protein [Caudoviricetes sp.]
MKKLFIPLYLPEDNLRAKSRNYFPSDSERTSE